VLKCGKCKQKCKHCPRFPSDSTRVQLTRFHALFREVCGSCEMRSVETAWRHFGMSRPWRCAITGDTPCPSPRVPAATRGRQATRQLLPTATKGEPRTPTATGVRSRGANMASCQSVEVEFPVAREMDQWKCQWQSGDG
jgi:hypothetical protein